MDIDAQLDAVDRGITTGTRDNKFGIPASQALKLAIVIVDLFRDMERLQHEAD